MQAKPYAHLNCSLKAKACLHQLPLNLNLKGIMDIEVSSAWNSLQRGFATSSVGKELVKLGFVGAGGINFGTPGSDETSHGMKFTL